MKRLLLLVLTFAIVILSSGNAFAQVSTQDTSVNINPGDLSWTITYPDSPMHFGDIDLDGVTTQEPTVRIPTFTVTDARGTAAGWRVTFHATALVDGTKTIAAPTLTTHAVLKEVDASGAPVGGGFDVTTGDDINITLAPVVIVRAQLNNGAGQFYYDATASDVLTLTIPPSTLQGNYEGDFTATLLNTP